jgi:hypothetical protein
MEKIKVIYIFGSGHTGSTLASLLLGCHSRIECVGELKAYERSLQSGRPCNCGQPVAECPYWKSVHGSLGVVPGNGFEGLNSTESDTFARANIAFSKAIFEVSGKDCLCDSSKSKRRVLAYLKSDVFDVRLLHLVRDPRAVACSNLRKGRSYWGYLSRWKKRNFKERDELFVAGLPEQAYHRVRYEDLVLRPSQVLGGFLEKAGLTFEERQLELWNQGNHHIAGNHMAKSTGNDLRLDRNYLDRLNRFQWIGASFLIKGAMRPFGYPISREATARFLSPESS